MAVAMRRRDLLETLSHLVRNSGFIPLLIAHWTSMALPIAERELEVAGYIIPLNKLWSLSTPYEAMSTIRNNEKPIIAVKPLAQGALANDLEGSAYICFPTDKGDSSISRCLLGNRSNANLFNAAKMRQMLTRDADLTILIEKLK